MKITETTPPVEKQYQIDLSKSELLYIKELCGRVSPSDDREIGMQQAGYTVWQAIEDVAP